eukprot:14604-Heterococcus_DN1.PRE.3
MAGCLLNGSNAMAFLHMYLRANAVNRYNNKWPPIRVFAIVLIIINWATLISLMRYVSHYATAAAK